MPFTIAGKRAGAFRAFVAPIPSPADSSRRVAIWMLVLVGLALLVLPAAVSAQATGEDDGYGLTSRRGLNQLDQINEVLRRYGKTPLKVAGVVLVLIVIKILSPIGMYHSFKDRLLNRAVRGVDDLVKRIEAEAAAVEPEPEEEEDADGGLLAGMTEVAEFAQGEAVPAYVLTVNDLMLDHIRITLKRLKRSTEGHAPRYRGYMFSVLKGIKTITAESIAAGVPSSLAVDVHEYFRDERCYKAWTKVLDHTQVEAENQEIADSFLLFMRNLRQGRPLVAPAPSEAPALETHAAPERPGGAIPTALSEETLPIIQKAAIKETKNLIAFIRTGQPQDERCAWQFELVRRQQQLQLRDESRRILVVFLSVQRKVLPQIIKSRMLPCRTWPHVAYMLGVADGAELHKRVEDRLLSIQEIIILAKAFLQTFAKRHSLEHVYGGGADAELMMDMHVPQIRRKALVLLRRSHETEPARFDRATKALNEEETPQHNEVRRLIEHYVHQRHDPPGLE